MCDKRAASSILYQGRIIAHLRTQRERRSGTAINRKVGLFVTRPDGLNWSTSKGYYYYCDLLRNGFIVSLVVSQPKHQLKFFLATFQTRPVGQTERERRVD